MILAGHQAVADWLNLTGAETSPNIAEIYVLDDRVRVLLEVYVGDIERFEELVPDDWLSDRTIERPSVEERVRLFGESKLQVVTDEGERLPARLDLVEPRLRKDRFSPFAGMINPITRQRVPEAPADKRVLYAELSYALDGKRPEYLTLIPPVDEEGRALVTIGFIAYHKSVPVIDFRYLGGPAKLNLNWADPWYSKFDNPNLKRHHKDALMSFLYVEPFEVRHEILTRVRDLEAWMDLGLRGDEYIELDELESLKQRVGEFFLEHNPVTIDGVPGEPILDRKNFVTVSIQGIRLVERPERMEINTAIVGVILAYLTDGMPQEVSVNWELFTDRIRQVPATATDPAGPLPTFVTPEDPVHTWTNFLKNYTLPTVEHVQLDSALTSFAVPLASLACLAGLIPVIYVTRRRRAGRRPVLLPFSLAVALLAGSVLLFPYARVSLARPAAMVRELSGDEAKQVMSSLLKNVYRAFDFREEADVYDKLALSVSGDLLADVYLQNRRSMAIQQAGGAQAKVKEVEVLEVRPADGSGGPLAYDYRVKWTAMGSVGHWGHVHIRQNLYDAMLTVEAVDGNWKITDLELLEEQRIDPYAQQ